MAISVAHHWHICVFLQLHSFFDTHWEWENTASRNNTVLRDLNPIANNSAGHSASWAYFYVIPNDWVLNYHIISYFAITSDARFINSWVISYHCPAPDHTVAADRGCFRFHYFLFLNILSFSYLEKIHAIWLKMALPYTIQYERSYFWLNNALGYCSVGFRIIHISYIFRERNSVVEEPIFQDLRRKRVLNEFAV